MKYKTLGRIHGAMQIGLMGYLGYLLGKPLLEQNQHVFNEIINNYSVSFVA